VTRAYIALGANLGDPAASVLAAFDALARVPQTTLRARSSLYRTKPVGLRNQPDFINAVAALDTDLAAEALLDQLFLIEARFGRSRSVPNAPRTLDLDLLLHGDSVLAGPRLILPHPRMHERAFVIAPLVEIAPDCRIPGHGEASRLLESNCAGQGIARLSQQIAA
jgi:2-amino-4-hydroxy-6-hydroxymethyldihydropteridine diphosphokinase